MVKKAILLLSAASCISGAAIAQHCATDEVQREYIKQYPQIEEIQKALNQTLRGSFLKTTATGADWEAAKEKEYQDEIANKVYIPVVVHVIHDYGTDNVPDTAIYRMIRNMNVVYAAQNTDLSQVIEPFQKYIGNMNIEFRLAQKDPQGNPSNGITRQRSYLTNGGDDQSKMGGWDPSRYMNIWIEKVIGRAPKSGVILAYATPPASGAAMPYTDGVIVAAPYINVTSKTIEHEVGHYFNLSHTWGNGEITDQICSGDDEVDDTPPTKGHFSTYPIYDTTCARGYVKVYPFAKDSLSPVEQVVVDYPDTTNVQNIMDYSSPVIMFTKQQVSRVRASLKSEVAKRNNLVKPLTQTITGILDPKQDIAPVADYSVEKGTGIGTERTYFLCADGSKKFLFKNQSWRDTISSVQWEFSNNASPATSSAMTGNVSVAVSQPGWVKVKLTATGNTSGLTGTLEDEQVYAADPNAISPMGYIQDFNQNGDLDKWPMFNYFKNSNKWQVTNNAGYYDNTSIQYTGFDERAFPASIVGTPNGDYDDFFTPGFDLTNMGENCNLNFLYSGAFRTVNSDLMKDVLEIHYSTTCGETWVKMDSLKKTGLANKGTYANKYAPLWHGDWDLHSVEIPQAARTSKTFFRFRYKAAGDDTYIKQGVGNNFYIDRINISPFPLGVNTLVTENGDVALAPNPTAGNSFVVIKGSMNTTAQVQVTDITGKVVYRTQQLLTDEISRIEIPASAIAVKGIYMVQVVTGSKSHTEKLVAY